MEAFIFIVFGWLVYILFFKNTNQGTSSQGQNDSVNNNYGSNQRQSFRKQNISYEKEANTVLIQRAIDSGRLLKFRYIDQDGEVTERTVRPEFLERRHDAQIQCLVAHCYLRGASRTFVIRRMKSIRIE